MAGTAPAWIKELVPCPTGLLSGAGSMLHAHLQQGLDEYLMRHPQLDASTLPEVEARDSYRNALSVGNALSDV